MCETFKSFKGVHKDCLSGYIAIFEFKRNLKRNQLLGECRLRVDCLRSSTQEAIHYNRPQFAP